MLRKLGVVSSLPGIYIKMAWSPLLAIDSCCDVSQYSSGAAKQRKEYPWIGESPATGTNQWYERTWSNQKRQHSWSVSEQWRWLWVFLFELSDDDSNAPPSRTEWATSLFCYLLEGKKWEEKSVPKNPQSRWKYPSRRKTARLDETTAPEASSLHKLATTIPLSTKSIWPSEFWMYHGAIWNSNCDSCK